MITGSLTMPLAGLEVTKAELSFNTLQKTFDFSLDVKYVKVGARFERAG